MLYKTHGSTTIGSFQGLSGFDGMRHFVSTRDGGISSGNFSSLNIGFHVGDDNFRVLKNRRILADEFGVDLGRFTFAHQCHSANVAIVNDACRGKGALEMETALPNTDGMITNAKNLCLGIQVADCVPVLFYDPQQQVIAALHAGWKSTLRKIVTVAVTKMMQHYGCRAENILAALGPSNGPCCYEVGEDVVKEARIALGNTKDIIKQAQKPGKYIFDQWAANIRQLKDAGLKEAHIECAKVCTQCNTSLFFSSRADEGYTGRFMAGIMLKKNHV